MAPLEARLKQCARELGFELVGIAPATPADGFERLRAWLDQGYAGEMAYMQRHAVARRHPSSVLADVRSVVMVGMNYLASGDASAPRVLGALTGLGKVARYARGEDYHDVL